MEPQHFKTNSPMEIPQENFIIKPGVHFVLDRSFDLENESLPTYFRARIDGIQGNFLLSDSDLKQFKEGDAILELIPKFKTGDCVENNSLPAIGVIASPGEWNQAFEDFLYEVNYQEIGKKRSLESLLSRCT